MSDLFTVPTVDQLTAAHRAVLHALALLPAGETKAGLLTLLQLNLIRDEGGKPVNTEKLGNLLADLEHQGWIVRTSGLPYRVAPNARNSVLLQLMDDTVELKGWEDLLTDHLSSPGTARGKPDLAQIQLQLWLAILQGKVAPAQDWLQRYQQAASHHSGALPQAPFKRLFANAAGRQLFDRLVDDIQVMLLLDYLPEANYRADTFREGYRYALSRLDDGYRDWDELTSLLQWQYLLRGELPLLLREASSGEGFALSGMFLLHVASGRHSEAVSTLQQWLQDLKSQTGQRKIELPADVNALYCIALLGSDNSTARNAALKSAISSGIRQHQGHSYYVLQHLLMQLEGSVPGGHIASPEPSQLVGLDGLLLALALYWLDVKAARTPQWQQALRQFVEQLQQEGYLWLAGEVDALIAAQFGGEAQLTALHGQFRLKPLHQAWRRQEAWQQALQALRQIGPGNQKSSEPRKTQAENRLAWWLSIGAHGAMLEAREQKQTGKGQWSKGRSVALRRLFEGDETLDYLSAQDERIIAALRQQYEHHHGGSSYELDAEKVLPLLVGHPAVFWSDAPDVGLDVVAGSVTMQLQEEGDTIRLALVPGKIHAESEIVWLKQTPTRLAVYQISREVRQIAAVLGKGLSVPRAAKNELLEAIRDIAPLVPVHTDMAELTAHIDKVAADEHLYAHLLPLQEGLRLQLLVRPLPGGNWFNPGEGLENLVGEIDGKAVRARRQLKKELKALKQVVDACPRLAASQGESLEWLLAEPQEALEVLSELQALDNKLLQCVWPEGERMRIKSRRGLPQLALGIRQQGEWFVLGGQLKLDDGRVLALKELLDLLRETPGRFLKLGDNDWLALTSAMKDRLQALAALADHESADGLRVSALLAPQLAGMLGDVGECDADGAWLEQQSRLQSLQDFTPEVPDTLQASLRDYQREGFAWMSRLAKWGVGACLADDMGLGKTVQTLALLLTRAADGPQLVVAPTSVALNWLSEAARFAPSLKVRAYHQQRTLAGLAANDLVVVSYGLLQQDAAQFAAVHWQTVVLDEAQAIKNAGTKRAQAVMDLQADFRLAASGTPVENHLGELWSLFRFLNPGLLGSQERFAQRFGHPIERGDDNARIALKNLIQPFILRRTKNQVLTELPPRTEITHKVPLSPDELHLYEALRQQAVEKIDELKGEDGRSAMQVLAEITRLRRFCCHPKLVMKDSELSGSKLAVFEKLVDELIENGHKALVFSQFVDHLTLVKQLLEAKGVRLQYLDGTTPARARKERVDAFQKGDGDIFLISLKAGGTGLNLTEADYVIHLDPWWNPAVEDQASDRAYRMGQQRPVTVYRLVAEHTIEEQIVALHAAKRDLADSLLEGGDASAKLDAEALLALLRGE